MVALLLLTAILAADPASDLAEQVAEQVRMLNADSLGDRTTAEKALTTLGPEALAHLPEVTDRTPPETAQRLARVRQALEQAQVDEAAKPSLVTLIGEDLPLADVIARISKETGNKIVDYREEFGEEVTEPRLKLNLEKVPFWQAIDEVLDQAELSIYDYSGSRDISLINRPPGQLERTKQVAYAGPFRLDAVRFEATRELRQPANRSLRLYLNVSWEPRLMPVAIKQPLDAIKVIGAGDVPIAVQGTEGEPEAAVSDESTAAELQVLLDLPPRSVAKITSLKGKLKVMVPGPMQTFRFDKLPIADAAKPNAKVAKVEQRKAGVVVTLDNVRKNNDVWEVRTRIKFDRAGDALESHRAWIFRNEVYLVGADKKRLSPGGFEQTRQDESEVGIAYLFDLPKGPAGMTFVYQTPTVIFEMPIEYELRDLDLP